MKSSEEIIGPRIQRSLSSGVLFEGREDHSHFAQSRNISKLRHFKAWFKYNLHIKSEKTVITLPRFGLIFAELAAWAVSTTLIKNIVRPTKSE